MLRRFHVMGRPMRKVVFVLALGFVLGAAVQETPVAQSTCPRDICEQDIWWDDCVNSPDPTSRNKCDFQANGECWNATCDPNEL